MQMLKERRIIFCWVIKGGYVHLHSSNMRLLNLTGLAFALGMEPAFSKFVLRAVLYGVLVGLMAASAVAQGGGRLQKMLNAGSAIIVDEHTGKRLDGFGENERKEVASLQKLLSALLIVRAGNLDKLITITAEDANCSPTKLPNSVGGTYTRMELLQAIMVNSSNDAARALARDHSGSEAAFGAKMTQLARSLGAGNSVFKNSTGFSANGQYSTAADMAIITRAAYRDRLLRQIARTKSLPWRDAKGKMHELKNSNRLLQRHENCAGFKIGFTGKAGHCAAVVWVENNRTLIGVVLNGRDQMFWIQTGLVLKLYANGLI
jgi:D-alanyl-D-alanine carboxypeptidase (penicillin-binding protein 5/6)